MYVYPYFLLLDQKKVSKEKSRQKKAASRTRQALPAFLSGHRAKETNIFSLNNLYET
jgi:hypothetical protein